MLGFRRMIPGRMRVYVHGLRQNPCLKEKIEEQMGQMVAVTFVKANTDTGRVLILFDETLVSSQMICQAIEKLQWEHSHLLKELAHAEAEVAPAAESFHEDHTRDRWHARSVDSTIKVLRTQLSGLPPNEVNERLGRHGPNRLREAPRPQWYRLFFRQFSNFMMVTLLASAFLSLLLGRMLDAASIFGVLLLNAGIGAFQEKKADNATQALRQLTSPMARVIRKGEEMTIPAHVLVPGDVIILDPGDQIPADARLIDCWNFEVDESSLTGESVPVRKKPEVCDLDTPLADRTNMLFMGSHVTCGRARAIVVATGMDTELGRLFAMIQQPSDETTPLQRKLNIMGKYLVYGSFAVSLFVVLMGLLRGMPIIDIVMTGISLATSAIPEGLPIMITIALAVGMRRMVGKNALVRKLSALETLGRATVICSDKTGTLTKNEMTVRAVASATRNWEVTGNGYTPIGGFKEGERQIDVQKVPDLKWILTVATLCSDATLLHNGEATDRRNITEQLAGVIPESGWTIHGDPTEGAILVAAAKGGIWSEDCRKPWQRIKEIPFESERRRMSVLCRDSHQNHHVIVKGAIEEILELCDRVQVDGEVVSLDPTYKESILKRNEEFASRALRVLAVAYKPLERLNGDLDKRDIDESDLIFLGLIGMIDPPREQVKESISSCKDAGIKVVMITGDHPKTAAAIARELTILQEEERILTGAELDELDDHQLTAMVHEIDVFARVSPQHKLRIVNAYKTRGEIVVMTGDGVNDAPAVKQADVGIAMGKMGVEVTKQASSMIITDDNFVTICRGVQEGRRVLGNIRKALGYLLSGNLGEVIYATLAVLVGMPLPLVPIQILLINLFTDALPSIAIAMGSGKQRQQPLSIQPTRDVTDSNLLTQIISRGVMIGLTTMAVFSGALAVTGNLALARTMAFMTICGSELIQAVDWWRKEEQVCRGDLWRDRFMAGTLAISWAGLLSIVYVPPLQNLFQTVPLTPLHWLIILGIGYSISLLNKSASQLVETWGKKFRQNDSSTYGHTIFKRRDEKWNLLNGSLQVY